MADIAEGDEILRFLTEQMRSGGAQQAMKAAELLGKRMGLFEAEREETVVPVIVDDIPKG